VVIQSEALEPARSPQDFLPLTPLSFLVLMVLADRDSHGYGMIKEVERRTPTIDGRWPHPGV